MAVRRMGIATETISTLMGAGTVAGLSDRQLLERFLFGGGAKAEAAFAALVLRHAPMVWRVCRELLRDVHDIEDASQATFLVLARRASTIRDPEKLSPWLYGVALRAARQVKASRERGRHQPVLNRDADPVDDSHSPESRTALREEIEALHEELARLPRKYREAVILCHLDGDTHTEAAHRLGCPPSTVSTRLIRARELLRARLARRGMAPAVGYLAMASAPREATASVAGLASWAAIAGRAAGRLATDRDSSKMVPARTSQLVEGILKTMMFAHMKMVTTSCLAVVLLVICGGVIARQESGEQRPDVPPNRNTSAEKTTSIPRRAAASETARDIVGPSRRYSDLVAEYRHNERSVNDAMAKLKSPSERAAYFASKWPLANKFTGRFLELARAHPEDPAAFDALAWIVLFGFSASESDTAAALLARGWPADPRLWTLGQEMSRWPTSMARETLLRAIIDNNPDRATRGRACLALARFLKDESEFVRELKTPGITPWHAQFLTKDRLAIFRPLDPDRLTREAEGLNERVIREFADIRPVELISRNNLDGDARKLFDFRPDVERPEGTLADLARSELEELRSPGIGDPAPEIDGKDVDDQRFKLSDFRGKVVVVTFSGNWCGPCRSMYPQERALMNRLQGRPFALLSVNTDEDKETLRESIKSGEITWRCWWEGVRKESAAVSQWGVKSWPTVCILDSRGIIRHKFVGQHTDNFDPKNPPMSELIEGLLKEMEAAPEPSPPAPPGGRKR